MLVGGKPVGGAIGASGEIAAEKGEAKKKRQETEAEAGEVPVLQAALE